MATTKAPVITVDDLISRGDPIWVKNRSETLEKKAKPSTITLSVNVDRVGQVCIIPPGPPILLTDQVPPKSLMESSDLRRLISLGALELVDHNTLPENAIEISRKSVAKWKDATRAKPSDRKRRKLDDSPKIEDDDDKSIARGMTPDRIAEIARAGSAEDDKDGQPSPQVITLVNSLRADLIDSNEFIEELDAVRVVLTVTDLDYISSDTTDPRILEWVQGVKEDLSE